MDFLLFYKNDIDMAFAVIAVFSLTALAMLYLVTDPEE